MKKKIASRIVAKPSKSLKRSGISGPESLLQKQKRCAEIIKILKEEFPDARCALNHDGPYQLLVATALSAQCTDDRVNKVTPALFEAAPTPEKMLELGLKKITALIKSVNYFNTKAKNVFAAAEILVSKHQSKVPADMDALVELPGVGRKTANVVLGNAFGVPSMVVDTHVKRISNLLKFTRQEDPEKIESDLCKIVEKSDWVQYSHLLILHGRKTCVARSPRCEQCSLAKYCPSRKEM